MFAFIFARTYANCLMPIWCCCNCIVVRLPHRKTVWFSLSPLKNCNFYRWSCKNVAYTSLKKDSFLAVNTMHITLAVVQCMHVMHIAVICKKCCLPFFAQSPLYFFMSTWFWHFLHNETFLSHVFFTQP